MENTGISFSNNVQDGPKENSFLFRNFYNGGGVGTGDINNDGLADVLFTSNMGENKLYLNKGDFRFDDITASSGLRQDSLWNTGISFADINHDGWLDLYICSSGHMSTGKRKNKLYINNRDLTFTESASQYGLDISAYATQASFFDYDRDGDLDMFLINNSPIPVNQLGYSNRRDLFEAEWPVADFLKGGGDHLYRNDDDHFTEVTKEAGIHGSLISFGLGVSVADVNGDHWPDVYVSNDSYERDYLYINQQNGTFKDEAEQWIQHTSFSSMGTDIVDVNNDGYPDMFTTDMLPYDDYRLKTTGSFDNIDLYRSKFNAGFYHQFVQNCLQLNNGNGKFSDIAFFSGVQATDWSWGALMFDADNDGWNDILVCNGVARDVTNLDFMDFFANEVNQKMVLTGKKESVEELLKKIPLTPLPNKAYRNNRDLKFISSEVDWGLDKPCFSNGAAYADLDNDGDYDLIINNINEQSFIYRNNSQQLKQANYISLVLEGSGKNTFAIGSQVKVYAGEQLFCRELIPCRGFQSSVDYKQVIGLGAIKDIDSVVITWPDATTSVYPKTGINKTLKIQQSKMSSPAFSTPSKADPLFTAVSNFFEKHVEDNYTDFYAEREIPEVLSREGPRAAVGDVDGDQLDDVYICGAAGQGGTLYLQNANGSFRKKPTTDFTTYQDFEDVTSLFFDSDKDGDQDLFVGSGGNKHSSESRELQNRLYKNDGRGNFKIDVNALPNSGMNNGVVVANDIDEDGDQDLFIGSRSTPQIYGLTPQSYLLMNNGDGTFIDQTLNMNKELAFAGMITGACFADVWGNSGKELVLTGEWMAPRVFSFTGGRYIEVPTALGKLHGWWQCVSAADLDGDGKDDLVFGNIGENFYLCPNESNPVKLWIADFDHNGSVDKIITRSINGKDMPVFLKRDMEDQIPYLKKLALKHQDFAVKSIQQLFPPADLEKAVVKIFNYPSSCVALNRGNATFEISKLPPAVQFSSVNAILVKNINNDQLPDLVIGGNNFNFLPQFCRLDASFGDVLVNAGKGRFEVMHPAVSGIEIRGVVREIKQVDTRSASLLLILQNDNKPVVYKIPTYPFSNSPAKRVQKKS
ncbi:CRTAC1 family protein [Segetibacter sp. 3557_3]|nr:CRTAC1 family protein [Segetibacter sp. 3557_3]